MLKRARRVPIRGAVVDALMDVFGINQTMDDFTGRTSDERGGDCQ